MAERRMIGRTVVCSDDFRAMTAEAQALYFQLLLDADDEGIVGSQDSVRRACGFGESAAAELVCHGFVLIVDGVAVITHWHMQNTIRSDRKIQTIHDGVLGQLDVNKNGVYLLKTLSKTRGHERGGERGIVEGSIVEDSVIPSPLSRASAWGIVLSDEERERLGVLLGEDVRDGYIEHLADYIRQTGKRYDSHYDTILKWWREDRRKGKAAPVRKSGSFDTDDFFNAAINRTYQNAGGSA